MVRAFFLVAVLAYLSYSCSIYLFSSKAGKEPSPQALKGFELWQTKNCQACHQLYGLGGYMGPDLTNLLSNPVKGPVYAFAYIKGGTQRMPNFGLSDPEIKDIVAFLKWVDESGRAVVPQDKVTAWGNYKLDSN